MHAGRPRFYFLWMSERSSSRDASERLDDVAISGSFPHFISPGFLEQLSAATDSPVIDASYGELPVTKGRQVPIDQCAGCPSPHGTKRIEVCNINQARADACGDEIEVHKKIFLDRTLDAPFCFSSRSRKAVESVSKYSNFTAASKDDKAMCFSAVGAMLVDNYLRTERARVFDWVTREDVVQSFTSRNWLRFSPTDGEVVECPALLRPAPSAQSADRGSVSLCPTRCATVKTAYYPPAGAHMLAVQRLIDAIAADRNIFWSTSRPAPSDTR